MCIARMKSIPRMYELLYSSSNIVSIISRRSIKVVKVLVQFPFFITMYMNKWKIMIMIVNERAASKLTTIKRANR